MHTIAEAKELNRAKGQYFFSRDTMRFFHSKIESTILADHYFITSERDTFNDRQPRKLYSVRRIDWETGDISTVGEFQGYRTKEAARKAVYEAAEKEDN